MALFIFFVSTLLFAQEATLSIMQKAQTKTFTLSEMLKRKDLEVITISDDPAYPGRKMIYDAIKMTQLFDKQQIDELAVIQYTATDGFSSVLSKDLILNTADNKAIAYLAIERPDHKWPLLKSGKSTAGPFYLVWKNQKLSSIGTEEWPYKLVSFEVKDSLEKLYPKIFPKNNLSKTDSAYKGFDLFVKNCFACHTMNKNGDSKMGPDLNLPMNPTEYFKESTLRKLIRNPQKVRHWPNSQMAGFDTESLSDEELNHIINYLKHMATRKQ